MSRVAVRNGLIAAAALWLLLALAVIFWHYLMLAIAGWIALAFMRTKLLGRKRRGTFAANVKAVALAYASWNSRWLKPSNVKVRTGKAKGAWPDPKAPGGVALSEDFPDGY